MARRKSCREIASIRRGVLRLAVAAGVALSLGACTGDDEADRALGEVGYITGFFGGVAADEPTAALIGRDTLTSGGSAVDAAVAMGFALSVSYPNAVSLGGGGVCVVHDATLGVTEAIDFLPPRASGGGGDRPTAVPALPRGMVALHARYGRLDWRRVVAPAEQLARFGTRVSRAFAAELAPAAGALFRDPTARRLLSGSSGEPVGEGERLRQPTLAATLGRIRSQGVGAFYTGTFARTLAEAYRAAGGRLTVDDLRDYRPEWRTTVLVPFGDTELHFAPPPAAAGVVEAQIWRMLATDGRYADASEAERPHLLAEASKRALADRRNWLDTDLMTPVPWADLVTPEHIAALFAGYDPAEASAPAPSADPRELFEATGGTGFVVADRQGMAVACGLTNYYPFGIGRIAPGTGIFPAAAPDGRGRNPLSVGPMIAINANNFDFRYAVAAGGGAFAQASLTQVTADILLGERTPAEAMAAKRVLGLDQPNIAVVESGGTAKAESLRSSGHEVEETQWPGRAAVLHCPKGLPTGGDGSARCAVAHDPRGFGLSTAAGPES